MTNRLEMLTAAYPKHIERIREEAGEAFFQGTPMSNAANLLASAFDWSSTEEGWGFWNDLYERGSHQQDEQA